MYKLDKTQIFFLHFAGGNCYSYDFLKKTMGFDTNFELISLELPGRGKRLHEDILVDFNAAVLDYYRQIRELRNDKPYMIYGHSMGATLGLFLTKKLEEVFDPPLSLVVSGNAGPGVIEIDENGIEVIKKRYLMNDEDFKTELRRLGGIPEEVLQSEELYEFFSPIMRSDFEVLEKENIDQDIQLKSPIYVLMGSEERNSKNIKNWERFTTSKFQYKILEGNHFFIHKHSDQIANIIINNSDELSLKPIY
ncbi:thioesterase II family protein [Aquimarina pacifica]|uniref:thioesterase II family protein n=1 Tax=Aquimarina pacifica TaxID=1296415 RepID=UPI00047109DD|nr:thioesterase domain-containing protein [Aquimarina pacifica]